MKRVNPIPKIRSVLQLYDAITENERIIVDVLRQVIAEHLPAHCKEKMAYQVPFFYGNKGICILWPASIPRGGIKKGVLLGFWYGCKLTDEDHYLIHGNNKQVYYKIFNTADEIDMEAVVKLLKEAIALDNSFNTPQIINSDLQISYQSLLTYVENHLHKLLRFHYKTLCH